MAEEEQTNLNNEQIENPEPNKKSNKLIITFTVLILLISGIGAAWFFGLFNFSNQTKNTEEQKKQVEEKLKAQNKEDLINSKSSKIVPPEQITYFKFPDLTVNLKGKNSFVKLSFTIELLKKEDEKIITTYLPRIIDQLQIFLRDLKYADFSGGGAIVKLKHAIELRINSVISPLKIYNVLIQGLLIQ